MNLSDGAEDQSLVKPLRCYKIFYISQSTAFITPILYLFVQERYGLAADQILKLTSVYGFLALLFQIPCGVLADKWGTKTALQASLILQMLSCIALITVSNHIAYHLYLVLIYVAQSLGSGASIALLKKQFSDDAKFKNYLFLTQNSFYKVTSVVLLGSSVLYILDFRIPFLLQIVNFLICSYFLSLIPERYLSNNKSTKRILQAGKEDLKRSLFFISKERGYVYLILCNVLFGLGVAINQKTIQLQFHSYLVHNQLVLMGVFFALGNLFSSFGSKLFLKHVIKRYSSSVEILVLLCLLLVSFFCMSFSCLPLVVVGFMLINTFKGCYRPILSAEVTNLYPFKSSLSTNLSIVSILTVLATSFLQYILSSSFSKIEQGNLLFAIFSLFIVLCGYFFSKAPTEWSIKDQTMPTTGKVGVVIKRNNSLFYQQFYPKGTPLEHLEKICSCVQSGLYPAKALSIIHTNHSIGVEGAYLGQEHLGDLLDTKRQYQICEMLLDIGSSYSESREYPAKILKPLHIFKTEILDILNSEPLFRKLHFIHGDLNPQNILITNGDPLVIDWDQAGMGPLWYDFLSLLSHPHLKFLKEERYKLFLRYCKNLQDDDLNFIFRAFCDFKVRQLNTLAMNNAKFKKIALEYKHMNLLYA